MSSGLYALPGASAAATAAACANRFEEPITKVSKTYLGLSRVSSTLPPDGPPACEGGPASSKGFVDLSGNVSVDLSPGRWADGPIKVGAVSPGGLGSSTGAGSSGSTVT